MHRALPLYHLGGVSFSIRERRYSQPSSPPHHHTQIYRAGVLQGQSDYPLTDVGRQQATATGRRLLAEWHAFSPHNDADDDDDDDDEAAAGEEVGHDDIFFHHVYSSDISRYTHDTGPRLDMYA